MIEKIKELFNKYFDYEIVGEYYATNGQGRYIKRYLKHYKLRKGCIGSRQKRKGA